MGMAQRYCNLDLRLEEVHKLRKFELMRQGWQRLLKVQEIRLEKTVRRKKWGKACFTSSTVVNIVKPDSTTKLLWKSRCGSRDVRCKLLNENWTCWNKSNAESDKEKSVHNVDKDFGIWSSKKIESWFICQKMYQITFLKILFWAKIKVPQ